MKYLPVMFATKKCIDNQDPQMIYPSDLIPRYFHVNDKLIFFGSG